MGEQKSKSFGSKPTAEPSSAMIAGSNVGAARRFSLHGRRLSIVVGVVVVVALVGGYLLFKQLRSPQVLTVCSSAIAQEAHAQNTLSNVDTFGELANRVKAKKDYTKDPNCMYVIAEYQITAGDLTAAKTTVDTLQSKYGAKYKYSASLDGGKASIQNLQQQLSDRQKAQDNSHGGIDPGI
jgi:hypothetical protein